MGMKTIREMMTTVQIVPTVMSLALSVFMSWTQKATTKKVRYPMRKMSHGALRLHQG